MFLLCRSSNLRDDPKETESVLKKIFDSTSIKLNNVWHIFASDIIWSCLLIYILWLFTILKAILHVTVFVDPHFHNTYVEVWEQSEERIFGLREREIERKNQGDEENPIERSPVIATRHQVIVGWYIKDNNVNRTWSVHLEMKNVRVFVGEFAGQNVVRSCIGERIMLKWVLNWYWVKTKNDLSQCRVQW